MMEQLQKRQRKTAYLIATLAILAASSIFLVVDDEDYYDYNDVSSSTNTAADVNMEENDISRSLMYSHYIHPDNSSISSLRSDSNNTNYDTSSSSATITIYVTGESDYKNPALSIFKTDIFQRYGSGRYDFEMVNFAPCDHSCGENETIKDILASYSNTNHNGPCLAVGRQRYHTCPYEKLQCTYPQCKTMVTNDEFCEWDMVDVRQYYSSSPTFEGKGYLPLGPRFDSWISLQSIKQSTTSNFHIKPASERRYAFNAIFSESTNYGRKTLRYLIDNSHLDREWKATNLKFYSNIARVWNANVNSENTAQLNTDKYIHVLLDSVFTLSPAGNNPECFRLYEAIETGSIPIMVHADLYGGGASIIGSRVGTRGGKGQGTRLKFTRCYSSLKDWYMAPIVVLEKWNDLFPTVMEMMKDMEKLNEMQIKLREWYDWYMGKVIYDFEDYMIGDGLYGKKVIE